ncbi:MAG: bifunctional response regulator/alkaline phosphatase family protein [Gemmatimonadetes bacterium]|nr:bifunctional response regulator/alkaline phosphatase family protein [Gemmatimonadota bacterium]
MTETKRILWVDDEIGGLKSHILFLEGRGFQVTTAPNGEDALAMISEDGYDAVLLDEQMPGMRGIQVFEAIRDTHPRLPVVMVTKSEEEHLMDQAIGRRVDDYLVKPINPNQVLSVLKRLLEGTQIRHQTIAQAFSRRYLELEDERKRVSTWDEWVALYRELLSWERRLIEAGERGLAESREELHRAANADFARWVQERYRGWVAADRDRRPVLSPDLVEVHVRPLLEADQGPVFFVIVDCLRLDQWLSIRDAVEPLFEIDEAFAGSILPSATPYSRNAIFSGWFPRDIAEKRPDLWIGDADIEGSMNPHEKELIELQLKRKGLGEAVPVPYHKVFTAEEGATALKRVPRALQSRLSAFVFNFIDVLTHGRSESEILLEIAPDPEAFRSLTRSWFLHSALYELLRQAARHGVRVVLTSDHGSIHCLRPATVYARRDATQNLRYKFGNNIHSDDPETAFREVDLETIGLPHMGTNVAALMAVEDYYFVYPTKLREYQSRYYGAFLHGGVSLEELILPVATLTPH